MYMAAGGAMQTHAPVVPISAHPGYSRQVYMFHSQSREGLDPNLYPQRSRGESGSPASAGSCEALSDSHESPSMTSANRNTLGMLSHCSSSVSDAKSSCNHYRGSDGYAKESASSETVQGFANSVPKIADSTGASPVTDPGLDEMRGSDAVRNNGNGAGIASNGTSVSTEQIPSSYEVNVGTGSSVVSAAYQQASRYSPMESIASTPISEDVSYSYNAEMARRDSIHSASSQPSHLENAYPNFYSGYPVAPSLTGQGSTHPAHLNPYQFPLPAYSGSHQAATSNGMLSTPDHPEMANLAHPGAYPGSASEGWNAHQSHGYGTLDYQRLAMSLPGHIPYPYQDGRHCGNCGAATAVYCMRRDGVGQYLCNSCIAFRTSGQIRMPQKPRGKMNACRRQICSNCGTTVTTLWRRSPDGSPVCNACGLYQKLHGVARPAAMKKDNIQTRKRKPKGQGKSKKTQRRQSAATDARSSEGLHATQSTATGSSSSASEATNHDSSENLSSNSSSVRFFGNAGNQANSLPYQRDASHHGRDSVDELSEASVIVSSGPDRTISDTSSSSPQSQQLSQSTCAVEATISNQTNEALPAASAITSPSISGSYSATDGAIGAAYSTALVNGSYDLCYQSNAYSGGAVPNTMADVGSSPLVYGPYNSNCHQQRLGSNSGSALVSTASTGSNFLTAASLIERPISMTDNYRSVLSSGYAGNDVGPSRFYRHMHQPHHPYSTPHYATGNSSAGS